MRGHVTNITSPSIFTFVLDRVGPEVKGEEAPGSYHIIYIYLWLEGLMSRKHLN